MEHGKTYAMYAITVTRRHSNGHVDHWYTYRRYREFDDLHQSLKENVSTRVVLIVSEGIFRSVSRNVNLSVENGVFTRFMIVRNRSILIVSKPEFWINYLTKRENSKVTGFAGFP